MYLKPHYFVSMQVAIEDQTGRKRYVIVSLLSGIKLRVCLNNFDSYPITLISKNIRVDCLQMLDESELVQ